MARGRPSNKAHSRSRTLLGRVAPGNSATYRHEARATTGHVSRPSNLEAKVARIQFRLCQLTSDDVQIPTP